MKLKTNDLLLYAITDRRWLNGESLENQVEKTLKAGTTILQLREKEMSYDDFLAEAKSIKTITDKYKIPFIINDNVEVAVNCNADGVHVGQEDMVADKVRKIIGNDKILGVSAKTVEEAVLAEKMGADYLGVGSIFGTTSKDDAKYCSIETLKKICETIKIPVVAIGGINENNIPQLKNTGIKGIAVISAIFAQKDIARSTENLLELTQQIL